MADDIRAIKSENVRIGLLDLLRGFLAFWVYYGHLKMASIGKDVLWGSPAIAVDGFMLLSGFLMVYHWLLREGKFLDHLEQTKDFYLRRFFRIAPLYYLFLSFALIFQNRYINIKNYVNGIVPAAWGGAVTIMDRPDFQPVDIWNVLTHFSFTFGFIPRYVNVNMLPDWSIALEMQFYLIFPLLVLLISKYGGTTLTFLVFLMTTAATKFIGLQEHAGLIARFPQPSFILFKLNIFMAGMSLAYAYLSKKDKDKVYWMILSLLALFNAPRQVWILFGILSLILFFDLEGKDLFSKIGNLRFSKFVGDTSYSLYLLHLLVMYPILYILFRTGWYFELPLYFRLFVSLALVSPVAYGLSFLLHHLIELKGIRLGKRAAARVVRLKS